MGDKSAIGWTDATWNPVTGCSKVSPGCARCYAETLTARYAGRPGFIAEHRPWTPANAAHNVKLWPERLRQPLRWRKPRMVFVNSMSDLFHERVPDTFIAEVFAVMALAQRHTFQILTKRPERMYSLLKSWSFCKLTMQAIFDLGREYDVRNHFIMADELSERSFGEALSNVWLGVSIENRRFVDRANWLRATPAAIRFISAEPLLGPLVGNTLTTAEWERASEAMPLDSGMPRLGESKADYERRTKVEWASNLDLTGIDWLIVGGESGVGHRPVDLQWIRDLRDAALATPCPYDTDGDGDCAACARGKTPGHHATAFFFKQVGGATPKSGGRELDGRTWDEMPR